MQRIQLTALPKSQRKVLIYESHCGDFELLVGFELRAIDVPLPKAACGLWLIAVQRRVIVFSMI